MVNGHYHDLLDLDNDFSLAVESSSSSTSSLTYIEHSVSKFDTLAGVAIKYGVEVADITKFLLVKQFTYHHLEGIHRLRLYQMLMIIMGLTALSRPLLGEESLISLSL
ncbi:hypothetical protein LIER_17499 [Lithospermum erythrorhizon]|uniref:Uncharacterized protein n=1 Tax=Lithospermum erythrorhizon TaxID=34254 RepID=A0AAV3QD89_LITER